MTSLSQKEFYKRESGEVVAALGSDIDQGLTSDQVKQQREHFGENILIEQKKFTLIDSFFAQLKNPLVVILLLAVAATLVLGEWLDSVVIGIAVIVNIAVALVQEGKADQAYRKLLESRHHEATVLRNGSKTVVDSSQVVVGDIVILEAGMFVPADIQIIQSRGLRSDQSLFTGESSPVSKNNKASTAESAYERENMVFSGSTISAGNARGIVVAVGANTEFGSLANHLQTVTSDDSPVERSTKKLAQVIGIISAAVIVVIVATGIIRGFSIFEILLLGIAVAVSAVPEGLASVVTVILAYGSEKIAKEGGLVKNLSAAQSLGSATIILTDKTGTLTFGNLEFEQVLGMNDPDQAKVLEHAVLATDVFYDKENGRYMGDEMDVALVDYYDQGKSQSQNLLSENNLVDDVPFDSAHKFFAALRKSAGQEALHVKGAFSVLWPACHKILDGNKVREVQEKDFGALRDMHNQAASEGKRVIAVCYREQPQDIDLNDLDTVKQNLVFAGFVVFADQMRESAPAAVKDARAKGMVVAMVTGDGPETARSIAFHSGITDSLDAEVVLGSDMEALDDDALYEGILSSKYQIFARVSPSDKLRLATVLGERDEVVAMTGDGVNDAAALKKAAIGISLASATEVAKESSGLVLTNNSFGVIVFAVSEGRRIVENIRKTIAYLLSTSLSEVVVIMCAILLALPIPFLPTHILWANLVEEGLMNFAYIFDPLQKNKSQHSTKTYKKIITKKLLLTTFTIAVINGLMFLLVFYWLNQGDFSEEKLRSMMFAILSVDSIFTALALRSLDTPIYKIPFFSNPFMLFSLVVSFGAFAFAIFTPFMRTLLHLEPFTVNDLLIVFAFGFVNLVVVEVVKFFSHRSYKDDYHDGQKQQMLAKSA